jgi:hypothetical protein
MIYFNTELLNLILNDKKTDYRMEFQEKNSLWQEIFTGPLFLDRFSIGIT